MCASFASVGTQIWRASSVVHMRALEVPLVVVSQVPMHFPRGHALVRIFVPEFATFLRLFGGHRFLSGSCERLSARHCIVLRLGSDNKLVSGCEHLAHGVVNLRFRHLRDLDHLVAVFDTVRVHETPLISGHRNDTLAADLVLHVVLLAQSKLHRLFFFLRKVHYLHALFVSLLF